MRRAFDWVFRSRETGRITIGQWPNPALWVYIAVSLLHAFVDWNPLRAVATIALMVWALDELVRGVNPFRRALGLLVLVATILP